MQTLLNITLFYMLIACVVAILRMLNGEGAFKATVTGFLWWPKFVEIFKENWEKHGK